MPHILTKFIPRISGWVKQGLTTTLLLALEIYDHGHLNVLIYTPHLQQSWYNQCFTLHQALVDWGLIQVKSTKAEYVSLLNTHKLYNTFQLTGKNPVMRTRTIIPLPCLDIDLGSTCATCSTKQTSLCLIHGAITSYPISVCGHQSPLFQCSSSSWMV